MRRAKVLRLSEQAIASLNRLTERTGVSETSIVEIALTVFEMQVRRALTAPEQAPAELAGSLSQVKKGRKRHKHHNPPANP